MVGSTKLEVGSKVDESGKWEVLQTVAFQWSRKLEQKKNRRNLLSPDK
jgi:hypothetical protein